jgi:hypothetical protein
MTPIDSWNFRYAATLVLRDAPGPLGLEEIARGLEAMGIEVPERRSKRVSDALRTEQRKGRVVRVGRGVYRTGRIPESTVRWFRGVVAHGIAVAEAAAAERWRESA